MVHKELYKLGLSHNRFHKELYKQGLSHIGKWFIKSYINKAIVTVGKWFINKSYIKRNLIASVCGS